MELKRSYGLIVNHKKILKIMKRNELKTRIRVKKYYSYKEKAVYKKACPNLLNRKFSPSYPDRVDCGDITELQYQNGKCYLYAVQDQGTKEIVSYCVTEKPTSELIVKTYSARLLKLSRHKRKILISHTDQGGQFLSDTYKYTLKKLDVTQSMSEKGNCLDNAPIESFFGHLKDEVDYKNCHDFLEVKKRVESHITYYNNDRPQWGLKGKTPAECRG